MSRRVSGRSRGDEHNYDDDSEVYYAPYAPSNVVDEGGVIDIEEGEIRPSNERAAGAGPRPGSDEWIKVKAAEMRAKSNRVDKGTDPDPYMDDYFYDVNDRPYYDRPDSPPPIPEEDPEIKKFIEKIKNQTVLLHQPDTGIIEPKYQGAAPIQTYTPPVIPAASFTNQESRQHVLNIFRERAAALIEAQGQQKLSTVIGDYIRDNNGNVINNLKWPKTVILFLTQGMTREKIDRFVANIGNLHGMIKDHAGMMDWIVELQNKPSELYLSDLAIITVEAKITKLKDELRNLRGVLAVSSVEVNVDKLSSIGKTLYSKIIGDEVTGIGTAVSNMANLYSSTYRYVAKNILKYTPEEMSHIDDDPVTLEQVYMNYLISGLAVSLFILMIPSCFEILNPWLDAIKTVITSFIVINYSDLIVMLVGESLTAACDITKAVTAQAKAITAQVRESCQTTMENLEELKHLLAVIYENVDQPDNEDGEPANAPNYISLRELIRQSDRPGHEAIRRLTGFTKTANEMLEEAEEEEDKSLYGMANEPEEEEEENQTWREVSPSAKKTKRGGSKKNRKKSRKGRAKPKRKVTRKGGRKHKYTRKNR